MSSTNGESLADFVNSSKDRKHLTASRRRRDNWAVAALLCVHISLLGWQAYKNAPNVNELAHLSSGLSHWRFGDFELYRVNPPLIRLIASVPLLFAVPAEDWHFRKLCRTPDARCEFLAGQTFARSNGRYIVDYLFWARCALIPISVSGALVSWTWASRRYSRRAGLLACTLWCSCPNLLAWGASITPDCGASAFGLLAAWRFSEWCERPRLSTALLAGGSLGVAILTKSTWLILLPLWPVLAMLHGVTSVRSLSFTGCSTAMPATTRTGRLNILQLALILVTGIYIVNLGYGFEGSLTQLGEYQFVSEFLGGRDAHHNTGNIFKETWISNMPVPLPKHFLQGLDLQKHDFEMGKWSYLGGEKRFGGWWYYYIYSILVKTPAGFLSLGAFASVLGIVRMSSWRRVSHELILIAVPLTLFAVVSFETGFSRHFRYVLPIYPFAYVFISRIAGCSDIQGRWSWLATAFLVSGVASSIFTFPHCHSYFNALAGGPAAGSNHLLDSNIDWGQDLLRLRDWANKNPHASPVFADVVANIPLDLVGIDAGRMPPPGLASSRSIHESFPPGYYAISVNHLLGYRLERPPDAYENPFLSMAPIGRIGYSIWLYRIKESEIHRQ